MQRPGLYRRIFSLRRVTAERFVMPQVKCEPPGLSSSFSRQGCQVFMSLEVAINAGDLSETGVIFGERGGVATLLSLQGRPPHATGAYA